MTNRLTVSSINEVSLVKQGADQDAHIVLWKSMDDNLTNSDVVEEEIITSVDEEIPVAEEAEMPDMPDIVAKALEGVEGAEGLSVEMLNAIANALQAAAVTTEPTAPVVDSAPEANTDIDKSAEEVEKSVDTPVDDTLEKALKEVDILKAEINREREAREVRDMLDVVRKEYSAFSEQAGDLGLALYRLEKNATTEEDRKVFKDILAQASRINTESALFKEAGSASQATSDVGGELEKIARGFMERDNINHAQAITKALETPEGKAAYEAGRRR